LGSGGQRSMSYSAKIRCKNSFWPDVSRTIRRISTKPPRHILQ